MQSIVRDEPFTVYEGMLADRAEREVSGVGSEMIYAGKALSVSLTADLDKNPPTVQGFTSGQKLYGVSVADITLERLTDPSNGQLNQAPYMAFLAKTPVRIVRKGRIWVKSADAVDNRSKSVFIRNASGLGTPASVVDTTTYPVADQNGNYIIITAYGYAPQTITFNSTTVNPFQVAQQINAMAIGVHATVVGGQVAVETDGIGSTQTIAIDAGDSDLTFDTPVAGTGSVAILSDDAKGSFRATATTGYTEFAAGSGLEWLGGKIENNTFWGLLGVNLS